MHYITFRVPVISDQSSGGIDEIDQAEQLKLYLEWWNGTAGHVELLKIEEE